MRSSVAMGLVGLLAVLAAWLIILKGPSKPPFVIESMAGCYLSDAQGANSKVIISSSGQFSYNGNTTFVSAYKDKEGFSLLPAIEILAKDNGELIFLKGEPLIMRIDKDGKGFMVSGEPDKPALFRKVPC